MPLRRTEMPSDAPLTLFTSNYPKKTTAAQNRSEPLFCSALFPDRRFHLKPAFEGDLDLGLGHYPYTFYRFPDRHIIVIKQRAAVLFQLFGYCFQHQTDVIAVLSLRFECCELAAKIAFLMRDIKIKVICMLTVISDDLG